jgi:hypothetical protein
MPGHGELSELELTKLATIRLLYLQQEQMLKKGAYRVDDRIFSIAQPHIRSIVRGKAGHSVEFGAKISIMCKLQETSETEIMIQLLVMNAAHRLRVADNRMKKQKVEVVQKHSIWQFTTSNSKRQICSCPV